MTSRKIFRVKINGIRDVYRINATNFKATLLKLSKEVDQLSAGIISVEQQFTSWGFRLRQFEKPSSETVIKTLPLRSRQNSSYAVTK